MSIKTKELKQYLNKLLMVSDYQDYGPNGLQVQGSTSIEKLAFAVSATRDSVEKAVSFGANALIVHHGLFWKFHGARPLTGTFARRIFPLVKDNINLLAYHLPLDAHQEFGNAAQIAQRLSMQNLQAFGHYKGMPTGVSGSLPRPMPSDELKKQLEKLLSHQVLHSCPDKEPIKTLGIITGGANDDWHRCIRLGIDAYLTGEISEHDWNEAQEAGIHFFAGGHHATERFGILALKDHIEHVFGMSADKTLFIDSHNPA